MFGGGHGGRRSGAWPTPLPAAHRTRPRRPHPRATTPTTVAVFATILLLRPSSSARDLFAIFIRAPDFPLRFVLCSTSSSLIGRGGLPRLVATSQLATSSTAVVPRSFWVLGGSCPHFTPKIAHAAPSIFNMPFAYDTARAPCSAAEIVSVSYGFVL